MDLTSIKSLTDNGTVHALLNYFWNFYYADVNGVHRPYRKVLRAGNYDTMEAVFRDLRETLLEEVQAAAIGQYRYTKNERKHLSQLCKILYGSKTLWEQGTFLADRRIKNEAAAENRRRRYGELGFLYDLPGLDRPQNEEDTDLVTRIAGNEPAANAVLAVNAREPITKEALYAVLCDTLLAGFDYDSFRYTYCRLLSEVSLYVYGDEKHWLKQYGINEAHIASLATVRDRDNRPERYKSLQFLYEILHLKEIFPRSKDFVYRLSRSKKLTERVLLARDGGTLTPQALYDICAEVLLRKFDYGTFSLNDFHVMRFISRMCYGSAEHWLTENGIDEARLRSAMERHKRDR